MTNNHLDEIYWDQRETLDSCIYIRVTDELVVPIPVYRLAGIIGALRAEYERVTGESI